MDDAPAIMSAPELPSGPRAALVIATARYGDPALRELRSPVRDADDLVAVLGDPAIGGFTVTTRRDETDSQVRLAIAEFLDGRGPEETVLVYLSCHGIQDHQGRLYFAAANTLKTRPRATAVKSVDVLEELDECRAWQQILILDCCFSGAFGERGKGEVDLEHQLAGRGRGRVILTASRSYEYSFEGEPLDGAATAGSVFTTGLVEGLRTGGADSNGDGYITWDEAFAYADRHVRAAGAKQTPQQWLVGAEGAKIILARSPAGRIVTPARLPEELTTSLVSSSEHVRIGAVNAVAEWLADHDPARILTATRTLRDIADRDNPRVAAAARAHLDRTGLPLSPAPVPSHARVGRLPIGEPVSGGGTLRTPRTSTVLNGHAGTVGAVAFSPDGIVLAAASSDGTAQIWEAATGEHLHTLTGHTEAISAVAFSPDGTVLATASSDKTTRLWDTPTGRNLDTLTGHSGMVAAVVFSPDGTVLATASNDWTAQIWDTATGEHLHTLAGHSGIVGAVAFSPDGTVLATASSDGTAQIWEAATGEHLHTLTGHTEAISAVAFSPDGTVLATASSDKTTRLWDTPTGRNLDTLTGHSGMVAAVAFSPDGALLATASSDKTTRLWDTATGQHLHTLTGHTEAISAVAFSPDGTVLATASSDGTARAWNPITGQAISRSMRGHTAAISAMVFSPDGTVLATASRDGTVQLWR